MDIKEKAKMYAEGKALNAITSAIEEAYVQGYRDGYKDCTDKVDIDPIEEIVDGVKYVNLDLPSEKEWSFGYLTRDKSNFRMPDMLTYRDASKFNIPTKEDFLELIKYCKMIPQKNSDNKVYAWILQNVNTAKYIYLSKSEREEFGKNIENESFKFWLRDDNPVGDERLCADGSSQGKLGKLYMNYRLPIMLVKLQ